MNRFQQFLLLAFTIIWIVAAIHPVYPESWLLENMLTFIFVPVILLVSRYFRLSNLSYALLATHMTMHVIGAHYTYAQVPFGYYLQHVFNADRNMYDRLVHFCFGFLVAYPVREMYMRIGHAKGVWSYWLPIELILAFSALYEIIEWLVTIAIPESPGMAFLGAQGDIWDAQKDMLMAFIGACIAMFLVALIHWRYDPNFGKDLRRSLHLWRGDEPLGEIKLRKLMEEDRRKK